MHLEAFERYAFACWESIPEHFREGVTQFVVDPGVFFKEEFDDGWVYGTCEPDAAMLALPEAPITSIITLYFGSFVHIASDAEDFDWREEIWETVRHELQHHLEWRSGVDHLGDDDDLQDENSRRVQGLPFAGDFHRLGTQLGRTAWLADGDLFVELELPEARWERVLGEPIEVSWGGVRAIAPPVPAELWTEGLIYADADLEELQDDRRLPFREVVLVLRRTRPWWRFWR